MHKEFLACRKEVVTSMLPTHTWLTISTPFPTFLATLCHMNKASSHFTLDHFFAKLCMFQYCNSGCHSNAIVILIRYSIEWLQIHFKTLQATYSSGSYTCFTFQCCFTQLAFAYFHHSISPAYIQLLTICVLALHMHLYYAYADLLFTLWVTVHLCKWTRNYSCIDSFSRM